MAKKFFAFPDNISRGIGYNSAGAANTGISAAGAITIQPVIFFNHNF
jgi:hypothetical protein